MPSLVPGYEYDIFISYRHKDNKGDQWVSGFVSALHTELDATFKEDISIYFDNNPHDGLLETHNVEKSLEGKLRCLIFLPIISQTYCDTKSFAWQHEFCAFNRMVKKDQLGRDIKLSNGNFGSRILPVKIHNLDAEDLTVLETELGGPLRSIEFIYREAGVNRPLKPTDSRVDNQNRTDYINQVNKVANAIKEMISALKKPVVQPPRTADIDLPTRNEPRNNRRLITSGFLILLLIITSVYFIYPKLFSSKEEEYTSKSIAVIPFKSLSVDPKDEYLTEWFYEEIINQLSIQEGLIVINKQSSDQVAIAGSIPQEISKRLNVQYLLTGSLRKDGDNLRITTRLEDANSGTILSVKTLDRKIGDYFNLLSEVAGRVVGDVGMTVSRGLIDFRSTSNLKAVEYLQQASKLKTVFPNDKQVYFYRKAIEEDSMCIEAWYGLANHYLFHYSNSNDSTILQSGVAAKEKIETIDKFGYTAKIVDMLYSYRVLNDLALAIKQADDILKIVPNNVQVLEIKGWAHRRLGEYQKSVDVQLQLLRRDPLSPHGKASIAVILIAHGQTRDARTIFADLRNSNLVDAYYIYELNCMAFENRMNELNVLLKNLDTEVNPVIDFKFRNMLKERGEVISAIQKKDYDSIFQLWSSADSFDSAMIKFLSGDFPRSKQLFARAKHVYQRKINIKNISPLSKLNYRMVYVIALAGTGDPEWENVLLQYKTEIDPLFEPVFYQTYVIASLVSGRKDKALNGLAEWSRKNTPYPIYNGVISPFAMLKNNPLFDPVRKESGFEELWEGNCLRFDPLTVDAD
jgi:TolB-like protein